MRTTQAMSSAPYGWKRSSILYGGDAHLELRWSCRRLANRESARKLRRKHATQLETGAAEVARLEAEHAQHQAQLVEGWHKYSGLKEENERLLQELQQLRALTVRHVCTWCCDISSSLQSSCL